MLISHFERLAPVCPACRVRGAGTALKVSLVEQEAGGDVRAGILGCSACGAEYPIIDGLPILVPDVRRFVQDGLFYLLAREDLPPALESLIGDAAGPQTGFDAIRQHLASYAWDHWADQDPAEEKGLAAPGAVVRALDAAFALLGGDLPDGPVLDVGCGGGRSTAELARRTGRPVLGIDLSFSLARLSHQAVVERRVSYPRRRVGLAYDRRSFDVTLDIPPDAADVWVCDLLALPFAPRTFALVAGLNVIDCLGDPRAGLAAIDDTLREGGAALLCTPFDWSANVTPFASWIGGHSQRGSHGGRAEPLLDMLLGEGPHAVGGLRKVGCADVPWHVRLHERSLMTYSAYLVAARRAHGLGALAPLTSAASAAP